MASITDVDVFAIQRSFGRIFDDNRRIGGKRNCKEQRENKEIEKVRDGDVMTHVS